MNRKRILPRKKEEKRRELELCISTLYENTRSVILFLFLLVDITIANNISTSPQTITQNNKNRSKTEQHIKLAQ